MTAIIILLCVVIVIGFALEVIVGRGGGPTILPPPDRPAPRGPTELQNGAETFPLPTRPRPTTPPSE